MIIGFAGRCRSGKTELAKICEQQGYTKLYFALPLKQLCADILDISIDGLNDAKSKNIDIGLTINDDICEIICNETNIPIDVVKKECNGKTINTVREMLQFIGTDLIRKYDEDWHVNRVKKMVKPNVDYVFDDVRFQNEKKMIEDFGGHCWFVTRTSLENVSNHESETSIKWNQCWNRIIINDSTLPNLQFKWETFMRNYSHSCSIREKEFNNILENGMKSDITPLSVLDVLMLSKAMFTYTPREFNKGEIKEITMNEDKSVFIKYKDDSVEMILNPLTIEDLKIFL